jgi:hypothetical protein
VAAIIEKGGIHLHRGHIPEPLAVKHFKYFRAFLEAQR